MPPAQREKRRRRRGRRFDPRYQRRRFREDFIRQGGGENPPPLQDDERVGELLWPHRWDDHFVLLKPSVVTIRVGGSLTAGKPGDDDRVIGDKRHGSIAAFGDDIPD